MRYGMKITATMALSYNMAGWNKLPMVLLGMKGLRSTLRDNQELSG